MQMVSLPLIGNQTSLGQYKVFADFAGTESYWPSHAVTAFTVDTAPETTTGVTPVGPQSTSLTHYFIPAVAGIIIAIAIVGALIKMLMLKKDDHKKNKHKTTFPFFSQLKIIGESWGGTFRCIS